MMAAELEFEKGAAVRGELHTPATYVCVIRCSNISWKSISQKPI